MPDKRKLGIWGNTECLQCGACCYVLYAGLSVRLNLEEEKLCKDYEIREGKAFCKTYPPAETLCADFFCDSLDEERAKLYRSVAEELGTAPKKK